ncbi:20S cyclosome subunit (BimA/Nuc2/Cdc27) [Penicillium chermesinum]|uniref:1-acyl-sn-glycerol-3-phosphate acyltransferase n=1 Tax=Penicillium chermesinum TaxID=63820 RepID=A0A9W9P5Z1_9EURO|nr:20S cyclosome subunit (BimA/Nuc2/Cdc27) [Penicillium chermesinum]KAJ5238445.1 20S cyclosome subunit (BimA/Nuc2/Cdc27) [Penicillium chermesinum]
MALSTGHVASQLRHLIYYNLDNNLIRNALFLAERLHAFEPRSFEAQYLLATCHLHNGQVKMALEACQSTGTRGLHAGCSYIYAQACLDLGMYLDGVTALERSKGQWASKNTWSKHSETQRHHLPDAAAVYCLQGKLYRAHKDLNKAVDCFVESLKLNPFMWDAFLGLCATGVNIKVPNIFQLSPELIAMVSSSESSDTVPDRFSPTEGSFPVQNTGNPLTDPFTVSNPRADPDATFGSSALWEKLNGSSVSVASPIAPVIHEGTETPQSSGSEEFRIANSAADSESTWEPPLAPARKSRTIQHMSLDQTTGQPPPKMRTTGIRPRTKPRPETDEASSEREPPPAPRIGDRKRTVSGQVAHPAPQQPPEPGAPQRRSVRLFNQIKPSTSKLSDSTLTGRDGREMKKVRSTAPRSRHGTTSTVGRVEYRTNSVPPVPPLPKQAEKTKEIEALNWLLGLFTKLASGYFLLSRYKCPDAIQQFNSLSQAQRETPWVLAQLGRAYFEQAMYGDSAKYFSRVQSLAPTRLEDMEIYSTVLWHLKNDVELAYLAHQTLEVDRLSPQAWCAIGNSFSHQRDHDQALKCFKRATALDPECAYAFTLQGHEYVSNEEYDKALDAYRRGIKADPRHYNAWYGLGTVYDKMGKLEEAEQHFRNAALINPTNAVLLCCIGLVLEKNNEPRKALVHYDRACSLAPQSILARFRKARVLMKLQENNSALAELKILKDMAPDEANVHYLLGKMYKIMHDKPNAIKHFTTALNLDPKVRQFPHRLQLSSKMQWSLLMMMMKWTTRTLHSSRALTARAPVVSPAYTSGTSGHLPRSAGGSTSTKSLPCTLPRRTRTPSPTMSISSYVQSGISSYVLITLSLFVLGQKVPRAAFVARCLASYGSLILCALYGVVASIVLRLVGYGRISQWATARSFKWVMRFTTGVRFEIVEGEEYLSTRPAVFIGNHQTELDVLMLGAIFPKYCSVTAKKSLRNVPFLGWFMALSRTVFIDRANRETAMKAFDGAADEMRNHRQSVFIFAEGTRSYSDKPTLLPFKKGAFHLAVKAGVPIVPVVTENYSHILSPKNWRFESGAIKVKVLPPIETKNLTPADVDELTTSARDSMLKTLMDMAQSETDSETDKTSSRANGVSTGVEI